MLNNIKANYYYKISSHQHEMNPLIKIICSIIFIIILFLAKTIWLNLILITLLLINMLVSNIPFKIYLKVIKKSLIFSIIIFLLNLLLGNTLYNSVMVLVKIVEIILSSTLILVTTKPLMIQKSFSKMLTPLKFIGVNIYRISYIMMAILEFIPRLFTVSDKIDKSQKSRNMFGKIKKCFTKFIPLIVLSYQNEKELKEVISLRLYNVSCYNNYNMKFKINMYDVAMIIFYVFILLLTIFEEVGLCAI